MTIKLASRFTCLWLILSILALPVLAQEPSAEADPAAKEAALTTAEEAQDLLDKTKQTDSEMTAVVADLKSADGEGLIILRTRFDKLLEASLAELHQLQKSITELNKTGKDVTQLELQEEQLLKRASRRLRRYIQSFQSDLEEQAVKRETLTADDLEAYEHRMAVDTNRLDGLYLSMIKLKEQMAVAGLVSCAVSS